jgi:Domain of unknown function (DUF4153)
MNRFANVLPELVDVLRRFPVAVLCCVLAFVISIFGLRDFSRGVGAPDTFGLMAGFLAGGSAHLFAETRKWAFLPSSLLAVVVAGLAGVLAYDPALLQSHRLFLFLGLALVLFVSPYLRRNVEQGAVWLFGLRMGLAAVLALVVGLTLLLGLYALVGGLKFLFGIDLGNQVWEHISALSVYLVGPLFGLSMVPRALDEVINLADHKDGLLERGVSILVNYIKVPLAFIYALLLHAYAVKIIVQQSMPKGEVGLVVTLFAIAGTLAWLLAWPFRETGTRLLKLYSRFWFWFLPVPVVLLALAVWQRVSDHGMTPDRYGLVLVALWAALVCGYLILRRSFADMRVVIGAAAVLLLLGSFGPWGAVGTTLNSQLVRFEEFLNDNAMLENGVLKKVLPELGQDAKKQGYSLLQILVETNAMDKVKSYLPKGETSQHAESGFVSDAMSKRFGVSEYWQDATVVNFNTTAVPVALPFAGDGRLAGPFQFGQWSLGATVVPGQAQFKKQGTFVVMTWSAQEGGEPVTVSLDQRVILERIKNMPPLAAGKNQSPLILDVTPETTLILNEGSGQLSAEKAELSTLNFWVVEKK